MSTLPVTPESSPIDARRYIVDALKLDLVGPSGDLGDPKEQLSGYIKPSAWYLTGFLIPTGTPPEQAGDEDEDEEMDTVLFPDVDPIESTEDKKSKQKAFFPSSMGVSFLVDKDTEAVSATVRWGDYELIKTDAEEAEKEEGNAEDSEEESENLRGSFWQRTPREETVRLALTRSRQTEYRSVPGSGGLQLHVVERPVEAPGLELSIPAGARSVSVFLVNYRAPRDRYSDEAYAFQAQLTVGCERPFVPRVDLRGALNTAHLDEATADLHYSNSPEYATGHAVSAEWSVRDGKCYEIKTSWIPEAEVEKTMTSKVADAELRMDVLGGLADGEAAGRALTPIFTAYRSWIDGQKGKLDHLSKTRRDTAEFLLSQASFAAKRLEAGIEMLERDPLALEAFRLANRAVSRALKQRLKEPDPEWRAFQLAFMLLNMPGVADRTDANSQTVDLLFFPTGGGKTEAYLGLAAFTMVLRRLQHSDSEMRAGAGVSIIMRYTLRLLTLDQLSRAAGLVCALELERSEQPEKYGAWPFEIGLWVGKAATPNLMGEKGDGRSDTARSLVIHFQASPRDKPSPIPLDSCPWCGTKFDEHSFQLLPNADKPKELLVICTNIDCEFTRNRPLPIVAVDEPLYRRLPAFLISTVDKFASLPWVGPSGVLLGGAERFDSHGFYGAANPNEGSRLPAPLLPPDLVIQDELHLISGPLGTMAGLYESAIEALCRRNGEGRRGGPKIVASTATVRRASEQIQALFGRASTQVFPPPGPNRNDSFFAETKSSKEVAARLYLGIAAQGRNPKVVMRKVWLALMGAAQQAYKDAGGDRTRPNPADPYMTVLGYFNSLRELGGGRRILEEEVQNTVKEYGRRQKLSDNRPIFANRRTFSEVVELTSRVSTDKVAEARTRLGIPFPDKRRVDSAIATNMISVGLDIQRLGLMVVMGQPKTHSEYIQATSRVGRDDKRPGLVVTLLNIHKPRDRSHYERFCHYHETFYRSVEVSSVTPFSARALDRGFPGVLVSLARHLDPRLTPPKGAQRIKEARADLERKLIEIFNERIAVTPFDSDAEREERRRSVQNRIVSLLDEWRRIYEDYYSDGVEMQYQQYELKIPRPLLVNMLDRDEENRKAFKIGRSLRDVEPSVNLYLREFTGRDVEENE